MKPNMFDQAISNMIRNLIKTAVGQEESPAWQKHFESMVRERGVMAAMPIRHWSWNTCTWGNTLVGYLGASVMEAGENGTFMGNVCTVIMTEEEQEMFAEWARAEKAKKMVELMGEEVNDD